MKHSLIFASLLAVVAALTAGAQPNVLDLSGTWKFQIDRDDVGQMQGWYKSDAFADSIVLPGSMPENLKGNIPSLATQWTGSLFDSSFYKDARYEKYRQPGNVMFPFFLTPDRHYVGAAWYSREIDIPKAWRGQQIVLTLERPHIKSQVWLDGAPLQADIDNSYCVPHVYRLGNKLKPGKHRLCIRVDNRLTLDINVGQNSHSITDQTQGNWNGIVGAMRLEAKPSVSLENIQVFPDIAAKKAVVKIALSNDATGTVLLSVESFNSATKHTPAPVSQAFAATGKSKEIVVELPMGDGMLLWDEFTPALYRLCAQVNVGKASDVRELQFGMREVTIRGKYIYINGRKTLMRGTVECCDFPATGYAPMDVDSWVRVLRVCKSYGLNHVRFHSYCPPAAAFAAADLVGFYLQPEGPSWPNYNSSLGNGKPIDKFLLDETIRMGKEYGNHPSYCMLASGNEPSGRWVSWVTKFVDYWKNTDPRRVYTGASVGGSWAWQPGNQYHVKAGARGLAWNKRPETMSDFRAKIDTVRQPFISHETGQWCAFPDFDEIRRYTGVNKAKNFELFREDLADHDMAEFAHDFMMASGRLQLLCYKHEIEKTLRTPGYAGFQLLSLNDYSGQGSALVGVLNVFFESKGYVTPQEFRHFCNSTVPLTRMEKFVFNDNETLRADVEIAHFGAMPLTNAQTTWTVRDEYGVVLAQGVLPPADIAIGNCIALGKVELPLQGLVRKASRLNLEVAVSGTDFANDWNFWVFPALSSDEKFADDVHVCTQFDNDAKQVLAQGGKVLLLTDGKVEYGKNIVQHFQPVFWNTSWFKMRPPHTTGILVNPAHPVFAHFPTAYHSDMQWWELVQGTQVMQLSDFPKGFQPLVQSIDTWFLNRKIGMLFEANVGGGKLMVCSMDIVRNLSERPAARQLRRSILEYMHSYKFRPAYNVPMEAVQNLFLKADERVKTYTLDAPDELKMK